MSPDQPPKNNEARLEAKLTRHIKVELKSDKLLIMIIILGLLISCKKDINLQYVRDNMWQYDKGMKVGQGDFMEFDDPELFDLQNDTIYYKGKAKAVVTDVSVRDNELTVKDLVTGFNGYYINVIEFTR